MDAILRLAFQVASNDIPKHCSIQTPSGLLMYRSAPQAAARLVSISTILPQQCRYVVVTGTWQHCVAGWSLSEPKHQLQIGSGLVYRQVCYCESDPHGVMSESACLIQPYPAYFVPAVNKQMIAGLKHTFATAIRKLFQL